LITSPAQRRPPPALHRRPPGIPAGRPSLAFLSLVLPHLHHVKELFTAVTIGPDAESSGPSRWPRSA